MNKTKSGMVKFEWLDLILLLFLYPSQTSIFLSRITKEKERPWRFQLFDLNTPLLNIFVAFCVPHFNVGEIQFILQNN